MSDARVDKGWQDKGIDTYSTEAILGTLKHYGVDVTEAQFTALTEKQFPFAIAADWHDHWKGKGQFLRFPAAAAEELWHRVRKGEVAPSDLALALVKLVSAMDEVLAGKADDGTRETRFKVVENYVASLPPPGDKRDRFEGELFAAFEEWMEPFDGMAQALAKRGFAAEADRFVAIEEKLLPVREGSARALVQVAKGDIDGGVRALAIIAGDGAREDFSRLAAIDGLLEHKQVHEAKKHLLSLVDKAEKDKDVELAAEVVEFLVRVLDLDPDPDDKDVLKQRVQQLAKTLAPLHGQGELPEP